MMKTLHVALALLAAVAAGTPVTISAVLARGRPA